MTRGSRGILLLAAGFAAAAAAPPAFASYLVDRNATKITLAVDAGNHALVSYVAAGKQRHVLIYGAINAIPPTTAKPQVAFKVDYSGGWKALHKPDYFKTIKNVCSPARYTGPQLPWLVSVCTMPDGTNWALQTWQRMLPNLGFAPWKPEQSVFELHISHWSGPLAQIDVFQDWAWGNRFHQIVGRYTYAGNPVFGFGSSSQGAPTDTYGRLMFLDTFNSAYGAGWARENSFLAQNPNGRFCYSLGPRDPYPGYPASGPRQGNGQQYRITATGPGVTPDILWQGNDVGDFDPNDADKVKLENDGNTLVHSFGFTPSQCHD